MEILIVEDDAAWRARLAEISSDCGAVPSVVGTGEDALAELVEREFAALLIDLGLPGISGFKLLQLVRASRPSLPIVVVTALLDDMVRSTAMRRGATAVVEKAQASAELPTILARVRRGNPDAEEPPSPT